MPSYSTLSFEVRKLILDFAESSTRRTWYENRKEKLANLHQAPALLATGNDPLYSPDLFIYLVKSRKTHRTGHRWTIDMGEGFMEHVFRVIPEGPFPNSPTMFYSTIRRYPTTAQFTPKSEWAH